MENQEFRNGCVITIPDDVTVVFISSENGTNNAQGTFYGDATTLANLVLHLVERIYDKLHDEHKRQFVEAIAEMIQKNPPEGVQVSTVTIRTNAKPEDEYE